MAGQADLHRNVFRLDAKFQDYLRGKRGSAAKLKQLRLAMLQLLEIGEKLPRLIRAVKRIYGGKTLLKRIVQAVERKEYALPKAIYDHAHLKASLNTACDTWACKPSELSTVNKLAASVGRSPGSFSKDLRSSEKSLEIGCLIDVEARREDLVVHIGERALHDMVLAAAEGYLVPKTKKTRFTEVYGLCLGTIRQQRVSRRGGGEYWVRHVYVERAAIQLRARGSRDAVIPDHKSFAVQVDMAKVLFPYLEVVGDFHSHPFLRARSIYRQVGWTLSGEDREYNLNWLKEMRELGQEPRVSFIVAIGRKKRASGRRIARPGLRHVKIMEIGRCLVAISAYRILRNAEYEANGVELEVLAQIPD